MKHLFTIPLSLPFVDILAKGLLDRTADDRLSLPRMTILLPTQRACRALREAFLRHSDAPLLLPRMMPLGDIDAEELTLQGAIDLPEAISPFRRQAILARTLISAGFTAIPAEAISLARSLAKFLDDMHTEEVSPEALATLVP